MYLLPRKLKSHIVNSDYNNRLSFPSCVYAMRSEGGGGWLNDFINKNVNFAQFWPKPGLFLPCDSVETPNEL